MTLMGLGFFRVAIPIFLFICLISYTNCSEGLNTSSTLPSRPSSGGTSGGGSSGGGGSGGGGGTPPATAQQYFDAVVKPLFNSRCIQCHDFVFAGGIAPVTIYEYSLAKPLLQTGASSVDNKLIRKAQGFDSHTGGNQCILGLTSSPCKELIAWWEAEFGIDPNARYAGRVSYITPLGEVSGWVADSKNLNLAVQVRLFADGPAGIGVDLGAVTANRPGSAVGYPGDHTFQFTLPAAYRNAAPHTLYAYAIGADGNYALQGIPVAFTAYTPKQAGMNYFNATVRPMLQQRCNACHADPVYIDIYNILIAPPPDKGGTALSNFLINKASATESHGGGNICGNKNSAPCLQMQEWWRLEFQ